jgi:predicted nucleic acid-binding protein
MRIYIDTSVVGGYYDKEFDAATKDFFAEVKSKGVTLVISDLLEAELMRAPDHVRTHLNKYFENQIERVELTKEAAGLADKYIDEGVVGKTSRADCQHIAMATLYKADVLVSWNFKHIVNLKRIRGYNSVNLRLGYTLLEIRTPKEMIEL